jgi:tetratricopeptide (TPR) repeat protein
LKNGRTIWADQVREAGQKLEYDVGEGTFAIPRSSVSSIEVGGVAPQTVDDAKSVDLAMFTPKASAPDDPSISRKLIRDGRVDDEVLAEMERAGDANIAATAYLLAGKREFEAGRMTQARNYLESAKRLNPDDPTILNYYSAVLVRGGNTGEALAYAERSVRLAPQSAESLAVLGYAQFAADHTPEAIHSWKASLAIRPDDGVQHMLEKAEREAAAEADFSLRESSHFTLRYEGQQTSESLRSELMRTLEDDYEDLARQFGSGPAGSIAVVLYTDQAFFDVTQAKSWTTAINDGKLRIPIEGVSSISPQLARVLKHELAHSFINQASSGRCPQWLNEGIAQSLEPRTVGTNGRRLAQLFAAHQDLPYNMLEGSFMQYSGAEAALAYDESLAAVEYIRDTYGMGDVVRVLERLNEGNSTEAALRAIAHCDYGQLETEVGQFLTRKYGN